MLGVASGEVVCAQEESWECRVWHLRKYSQSGCKAYFGPILPLNKSVTVLINARRGSLRQWKRVVQPGDAVSWSSVISGTAGSRILYSFCFCEDDSRSFFIYAVFHVAKLVLNVLLAEDDLDLFYLCASVDHRSAGSSVPQKPPTFFFLFFFFFSQIVSHEDQAGLKLTM